MHYHGHPNTKQSHPPIVNTVVIRLFNVSDPILAHHIIHIHYHGYTNTTTKQSQTPIVNTVVIRLPNVTVSVLARHTKNIHYH